MFNSPTQPLSVTGIVSMSKLVLANMSCERLSGWTMSGSMLMLLVCSIQWLAVCGGIDGEPIADEMVLGAEAPESDVDERTGGCLRSKEGAAECDGDVYASLWL